MHGLAHDLRFALRQARKTPGFTLTVVLTLALGIGATTAIFSLVEAVLLRPLPFADPGRLVILGDHLGRSPNLPVTAREIRAYAESTAAFSSMGAYLATTCELSGGAVPEPVHAARVGAGVFPTLGVAPVLGRVFTQQDEDARRPLAVISHAFWLDHFGRDPRALGSSLTLDRKLYTVVGVMPRDFEFPLQGGRLGQARLWIPLSLTPDELSDQQAGAWAFHLVARLKPGVTPAQAAQDADRVARQIMRSFPPGMSAIRIRGDIVPLRENTVADVRPLLRTLFLAVAVVLLIACANVAGLLLVRAIRRRREFALRLALGARPAAILRQSCCEGLVLSLAGGLLGLAFAAVAIPAALLLLPDSMPRAAAISLDAGVAAFALLLALASGVACSLAPAFAALRTNLTQSLQEGARTGSTGHGHARLRSALVVSEIAVALALLTVSAAFLRSFQKMRAVDPGFRPDHVLVAGFQLPRAQYPTEASVETFRRALHDRLAAYPGIVAVGFGGALPASNASGMSTYTIEGEPVDSWKLKFAAFVMNDGGYFRALGIPLLDGRYFTADDRPDAPLVVVVNQTMAAHSWPGQRAVGKRIHLGNPQKLLPWATVVGVVADTKLGPRDEPSSEQWYLPARQPAILYGSGYSGALPQPASGYIALRSALPPERMVQTLRAAVAEVDPLLALQQVRPMADVMSGVEAPRRFNTSLITAFAAGALLLAITGIYAVVAFSVSLRTHEIAIRIALGARPGGIARLVLAAGARLALAGCALGVLGALAVSRLVSSFLFEVSPTDPLIYLASVALMLLMALLASALPATRAASTDPIDALHSA